MSNEHEQSDVYWVDRPPGFDLAAALRSQQVEFWYQPKISLRLKRLVGVEAFARFRDPDGRIVSARNLMAGADSGAVVRLTEQALVSALKTSVNLCEIGVDVRLAINVSMEALTRLPITDIVRRYRPDGGKCLSLVFDVSEEQVLRHVAELSRISAKLRACGFSVAVDDFGAALISIVREKEAYEKIDRTFAAIQRLKNVRFAEMKLDRSLVQGCGGDPHRQNVCKHIIDLTHHFGSAAVAVGIERAADLHALRELDCDIGQGYLFGKPMSEEEFLILLWDRSVRAKQRAA